MPTLGSLQNCTSRIAASLIDVWESVEQGATIIRYGVINSKVNTRGTNIQRE
jgi:hypothetical protein